MASGKKNYFRHSFYASKDDKIVNLITEHGKQAYFHYFRLLELCGEQCAEEVPEKFVFHRRTLCAELMVTNSRLGHHLLAMQSSLLLHYVLTDRKVEILIPNLAKYLGKYTNKNQPNTPNKRKEKERKEKEIKLNKKNKIATDDLMQHWNEFMASDATYNFEYCRGLGSGEHVKNFCEAVKFLPEKKHWTELFEKCKSSNYLNGKGESGWRVSLTWLVNYDNAIKVLNGNYSGDKRKDLFKFLEEIDDE